MKEMTFSIKVKALDIHADTTLEDIYEGVIRVVRRIYGPLESFDPNYARTANEKYYAVIRRWVFAYVVPEQIVAAGDLPRAHWIHIDTMEGYKNGRGEVLNLFKMRTSLGYEKAVEMANLVQFLVTGGK